LPSAAIRHSEPGKKLVACRGGIDHDKWVPPQPGDPIVRVDTYTDEKTGEVLKTEENPVWGACRTELFVLEIELFKDNTTWTEEARLTSDPVHLFTMDVIAGIEIQTAPGETVKAKMWTGDDPEHKGTIYLQETGAGTGVYRNTGPGAAPYFYEEYQPSANRLKVVNEDKKWYVVPIVDDKENPNLEVSEKVDAAEVAAVDGTPSLDAAEIHNDMRADPHYWNGVALYDVNHNPAQGTGAKCVELGAQVDLLNVSGHSHRPTVGISGEDGYGLKTDNFDPSDIGSAWDEGELEWCLLAACFQVSVDGPEPQSDWGKTWIQAMPNVHALLGYRLEAPTDGVDVAIANAFAERLAPGGDNHDYVHMAWMLANRPSSTDCTNRHGSCIVNVNNLDDKMYTLEYFPTADDPGNEYQYFFITWEGLIFKTYTIQYFTFTLP